MKTAIIDAAEVVFAIKGFDGSTTRAIAEEAGVNLALIHYHFSSKGKLYELVLSRRLTYMNELRRGHLHKVMSEGKPTLDAVLDAFMRPAIEHVSKLGQSGVHHARIVAQIIYGADERSARLRNDIFGPIAREFIAAIRQAEPKLDALDAVRAYAYSGTLLINELTGEARRTAQMGGVHFADETEDIIRRIKIFAVAGVNAMANSR